MLNSCKPLERSQEGSLWPNVFLRRAWAMRHAQETGSADARGREVGTVPPDPCGGPLLTWFILNFLPLSPFKHFIFWRCWSSLRCVALASCGAQAQLPCGMCGLSSSTRDWTHIPHTGRQILNHWTTREVPSLLSPSQTFLSLLSHLSVNGTATESNWRYDISSMGRRPAIGQHQWGSPKRTGHAGLAQNPTWILKAISHRRKQTVRTGLAFKFFKKLINQPIN